MSLEDGLNFLISEYPQPTTLKIVCAWCGKTLGYKDGKGISGITHWICDDCLKYVTIQLGK